MTKTNVMRLLEAAGIAYRTAEYEYDEANLSGLHAAEQVGMDADQVFKTLVTRGDKTGILVFCIPVDMEGGNDAHEGASGADGLYPRRLLPNRNEEKVPHLY